ncbi:MAG TPA: dihydrofolate reductase family protein [Solirubrobacteraceae bacterium]|jgi:dihydrofolate reductase|nr:dihydrofolate reductase family protein [Solirubrobacteraceae bacterium]
MSAVILDISMSLDGFVAGHDPSDDEPLGRGGDRLHEWAFRTRAFRRPHGMEGGEDNEESAMVEKRLARIGAEIMGRRKYSGGAGPWEADGNANGWWGTSPPFHYPVFVLSHHARPPLPMEGGTTFTFVTDGVEAALEQAHGAAGGRDVLIGGGADVAQQYLRAELVDELHLAVAPVLLGGGRRLFEHHVAQPPEGLEPAGVLASPSGTTHLSYRRRGTRSP